MSLACQKKSWTVCCFETFLMAHWKKKINIFFLSMTPLFLCIFWLVLTNSMQIEVYSGRFQLGVEAFRRHHHFIIIFAQQRENRVCLMQKKRSDNIKKHGTFLILPSSASWLWDGSWLVYKFYKGCMIGYHNLQKGAYEVVVKKG